MSRFDYVAYDEHAQKAQSAAKELVQKLEHLIMATAFQAMSFEPTEGGVRFSLPENASDIQKSQVENARRSIEKLEEAYMWIGKTIRDDQIRRNGSAPMQEERKDS